MDERKELINCITEHALYGENKQGGLLQYFDERSMTIRAIKKQIEDDVNNNQYITDIAKLTFEDRSYSSVSGGTSVGFRINYIYDEDLIAAHERRVAYINQYLRRNATKDVLEKVRVSVTRHSEIVVMYDMSKTFLIDFNATQVRCNKMLDGIIKEINLLKVKEQDE